VKTPDLIRLLAERTQECGEKPLYTFLNKNLEPATRISYAELSVRTRLIAAHIYEKRLHGTPAILLFPHSPEFIYSFFGCMRSGQVPVPVSLPRGANIAPLERVIRHCAPKYLMTLSGVLSSSAQRCMEALGVSIVYVDTIDFGETSSGSMATEHSSELSFIQYSSGTTATPKGVAITHANILDNSERIKQAFGSSDQDIGLCWLPFYHDMGLIGHLIQPLYTKIHNYFISPLSFVANPLYWLRAIDRFNVTISGGPNFGYSLCNTKIPEDHAAALDLSSWRLAYCGSERIDPEVVATFITKFRKAKFRGESFYACCQWPSILTHLWPIKLTHLISSKVPFSASVDSSLLPA
jgi:acyl-CoA synthetase (AMP-forming)/AMP-acid ligase II